MIEEVFRTFEEPISAPDGTPYVARICGRRRETGRWEGWIEFIPESGRPVLRSQRETTQSDRRNFEGWADRLRQVYLEGSLRRTLEMEEPRRALPPRETEQPRYPGPAPGRFVRRPMAPDEAVFNPFLAYRRGEAALRKTLWELSASDLRIVARAFDLDTARGISADRLAKPQLVDLIVAVVRERVDEP